MGKNIDWSIFHRLVKKNDWGKSDRYKGTSFCGIDDVNYLPNFDYIKRFVLFFSFRHL